MRDKDREPPEDLEDRDECEEWPVPYEDDEERKRSSLFSYSSLVSVLQSA